MISTILLLGILNEPFYSLFRDQKTDLVMDMKDELEQARLIIQKLQQDKRELAEDAKATRAYRDEIEMLKVQSSKADKLETDVVKYRQKAEDTEYLKKKIAVSSVIENVYLLLFAGTYCEFFGKFCTHEKFGTNFFW